MEALHHMGVAEAAAAAAGEVGKQKAKEVLHAFYKDKREATNAKVWALKAAGYDTTELEAEIARRRQTAEEKKQATAHGGHKRTDAATAQEAGFGISMITIGKNIYERFVQYIGLGDDKDYMTKVYEIAEDVVNDTDVQPNYTNEHGTRGTWCNKALDRMLDRLGVDRDEMLNSNPRTGKPDIGWTSANDMAKNLEAAAQKNNGVVLIEGGKSAQEHANRGYAVVAAWYNPKGSGHVALVIPDNIKNYNDDIGPKIAQAGKRNYGPSDNTHINTGFFKNWQNKVRFYIIK